MLPQLFGHGALFRRDFRLNTQYMATCGSKIIDFCSFRTCINNVIVPLSSHMLLLCRLMSVKFSYPSFFLRSNKLPINSNGITSVFQITVFGCASRDIVNFYHNLFY